MTYLKSRHWAFWVSAVIFIWAVGNLATMHYTGHQVLGRDADLAAAIGWGVAALLSLILYVHEARRLP